MRVQPYIQSMPETDTWSRNILPNITKIEAKLSNVLFLFNFNINATNTNLNFMFVLNAYTIQSAANCSPACDYFSLNK